MAWRLFGHTPDYSGMANAQEAQRQAAITQGTQRVNDAFSQFDPAFYQQREQAYYNYAMPQLAQQYQQQQKQTNFGLANRGLLGGSQNVRQQSELTKANLASQRTIGDAGIAQSQALQQQIESARDTVLHNLYASADPGGAGAQAISTAAGFAQPSVFQPLGNMFSQLANTYAQSRQSQMYGLYPQTGYGYPMQQGYAGPNTPVTENY